MTLQTPQTDRIISLASEFSSIGVSISNGPAPAQNLVDLSKMMSVFGSFYEIEFFHDGQEYKHKHSMWVPVVNRYLAGLFFILNGVAIANGLW